MNEIAGINKRRRMPSLPLCPGIQWIEGPGCTPWTRSFQHQCGVLVLIGDEQHEMGCGFDCPHSGDAWWRHISFSRSDRMPDYRDIAAVRNNFVMPDEDAIMVMPRLDRHINIHPFCLHLWVPLNHNPLPDFRVVYSDGEAAI